MCERVVLKKTSIQLYDHLRMQLFSLNKLDMMTLSISSRSSNRLSSKGYFLSL